MESAYQQVMWVAWWQDADWVVRAILLLLVGLSVLSWAIIFWKSWHLGRVDREERRLAQVTAGAAAVAGAGPGGGRGDRSISGQALRRALVAVGDAVGGGPDRAALREHLEQELVQERIRLESHLTVLASIGSSAPFIGLLGTVWGIMHALGSLHGVTELSLDRVAGPVGEALVATAAGLFTAIPAVMAYNLLVRRLRRIGALLSGNALRLLDGALRERSGRVPSRSVAAREGGL